jgi:hypothetical protein
MSEAWKYGVRHKDIVMFCELFEYNTLILDRASARDAIITLITELEGYPPESWHMVLKLLRWQLEEHPRDHGLMF